jgi:hypothetical protein
VADILVRIKRTVLAGRYAFSEKARIEMESDGLTEFDVAESIINYEDGYEKRKTLCFRLSKLRQFCDPQGERKLDGQL